MNPGIDIQAQIDQMEQRVATLQAEVTSFKAAALSEMSNLKTAVFGDPTLRILGLLDQFDGLRVEISNLRKDLAELLAWRSEVTRLLRWGLGAVGLGSGASAASLIKSLLENL